MPAAPRNDHDVCCCRGAPRSANARWALQAARRAAGRLAGLPGWDGRPPAPAAALPTRGRCPARLLVLHLSRARAGLSVSLPPSSAACDARAGHTRRSQRASRPPCAWRAWRATGEPSCTTRTTGRTAAGSDALPPFCPCLPHTSWKPAASQRPAPSAREERLRRPLRTLTPHRRHRRRRRRRRRRK